MKNFKKHFFTVHKRKMLLLTILIFMMTFCSNAYCNMDSDSESAVPIINEDDILADIRSEIESEREAGGISAMLIDDDISNQIEIKSVYADEGSIIGMLFEYTGSSDITVTIDDTEFAVTDSPDSNGYIYQYFDNLTTEHDYVNVSFSDGSQTTDTQQITLTQAVEADNGTWLTSSDGHKLYIFIGDDTALSGSAVVVPNIYNGEIITDVGGYYTSKGYYTIFSGNTSISDADTLEISEGIINLGDYACFGASNISSVAMPSTLETIGGLSFYGTSLRGEIVLPANTREIYSGAFYGTAITYLEFNNSLERICSAAFYGCTKIGGSLVLPDSLYYIGSNAFAYCTDVSGDIDLPDNLYYLGSNAFAYCTGITGELEIPGYVTDIGSGAFWGCSSISSLILNEGVETIGAMAFANSGSNGQVMNITSVTFPSSLKSIGYYAFQYCTKIKTITLNEGLEVIGDGAFNHMTGITDTSFTIPSTVKTIGGDYNVSENTGYSAHVFYDMGQTATFTEFKVADGNEYFAAKDGVLYDIDITRMIAYPRGKTDTEFTIPEGVTQLDELSFSKAEYLEKITLPDSYTVNIDMPDNVLNPNLNGLSAAIYANTGVKEIAVNSTNTKYKTIDGMLYSYDGTVLYYIPNQYSGIVSIADGTERIEKGCICAYNKANTNWTYINIPSTTEYIYPDVLDFINTYFTSCCAVVGNVYKQDTDGTVYLTGDADTDGSLDTDDSALVLKYVILNGELPNNTAFRESAADVNEDDNIDLLDSVEILKLIQQASAE